MSTLMQIDGSLGEGGGQVLRIALSLSVLYKIPIKIDNIRAGRPKPGLAAQHLAGIRLMKQMCNAEVSGAYTGSKSLEFKPGQFNVDEKWSFSVDVGTAGCIGLLVQVALPCALFFPQKDVVTLYLKGGTNVPMGPQMEYLTKVMKPLLNKFGADFECNIITRGYYPKGGGEVLLYIKPIHVLNAITLTNPGIPREIVGWAYVAGVFPIVEAQKMEKDASSALTEELNKHNIPLPSINIESYKEDKYRVVGSGFGINIVCRTTGDCIFGGSALGSQRQEQNSPGNRAASEILEPILTRSCVDKYAQDQLIILMALAKGVSRIDLGSQKLTCHTETAIKVAEMMLSDFNLHFKLSEKVDAGNNISRTLECEGCAYERKSTL